jgi:hypothetical protein
VVNVLRTWCSSEGEPFSELEVSEFIVDWSLLKEGSVDMSRRRG